MIELSRLLFREEEKRGRNYFHVYIYSDFRNVFSFKERAKYYSDGQVLGIERMLIFLMILHGY